MVDVDDLLDRLSEKYEGEIHIYQHEKKFVFAALKAADARYVLNNYHPAVTSKSYQDVSREAAQSESAYAALRQEDIKK